MRRVLPTVAFTLTIFWCGIATAQTATVAKNVNLRADPSTNNPPIRLLAAGERVTLMAPTPTDGFYHVRSSDGTEGWTWSKNVRVTATPSAAAGAPAGHPVFTTLEACPPQGTEPADSPHGLFNEAKRHTPTGTTPAVLTFDDFRALEQQAESRVASGKGSNLSAADRAKIQHLTIHGQQVGEGDLVAVVGFVIGSPHANTGESVNCGLKNSANNDFHIPFGRAAHQSPYEGLVVEMIPQHRPTAWTLAKLKALSTSGQEVMAVGQLFFDNEHEVNATPPPAGQTDKTGNPPRFALWEVHPITAFMICQRSDNACDPNQPSQWKPLQ